MIKHNVLYFYIKEHIFQKVQPYFTAFFLFWSLVNIQVLYTELLIVNFSLKLSSTFKLLYAALCALAVNKMASFSEIFILIKKKEEDNTLTK